MEPLLFVVDAFTGQPFSGNPAGVCLLDHPYPEAWMQSFAAEMKHSETAFLLPEGDGYRLRWFTPAIEVDLCGHATLASAHTLFETGRLKPDEQACFYTRSGLLTARTKDGYIELNFPADPVSPVPAPAGMLEALGIRQAAFVGKDRFDFFVELGDGQDIRSLSPDFAALKLLPARGFVVTTREPGRPYDFVSRFFAPQAGVNEDPVTGSAHCALAPYWGARLGKTEMTAYQASARGGNLRVRLEGDRVVLAGQAVTIFSARLSAKVTD